MLQRGDEGRTSKPIIRDRIIVSSFRIEGLGDLEIHDKNLCYQGHLVSFEAIRSVRFTATEIQHSVNFIPTGSTFTAELYLILEGGELLQIRQESAFRGKILKTKDGGRLASRWNHLDSNLQPAS